MNLTTEFFENRKIKRLRATAGGDAALIILIKLKIEAGRSGRLNGDIEEIAERIEEDQDNTFRALFDLLRFGLVDQLPDGRFVVSI